MATNPAITGGERTRDHNDNRQPEDERTGWVAEGGHIGLHCGSSPGTNRARRANATDMRHLSDYHYHCRPAATAIAADRRERG